MATKISAMTAASTLDGTESIELVQGANSRKVVLNTALSDLNVVQQDAVTGALEVGGTAIDGIPSFTWASKPAAADVVLGSYINIPASEFTHTSVPAEGLTFQSDLLNWKPAYGGQILAREWDLDATGVVTLAAGGTVEVALTLPGGQPVLLDGMAYIGMEMEIEAYYKSVEANAAATYNVRFGTGKTIADGIVAFATASIGADKDTQIKSMVRFVSSTKVLCAPFTGVNNSGTAGVTYNNTVNNGVGYTHGFTFTIDPGNALDSFILTGYTIKLRP